MNAVHCKPPTPLFGLLAGLSIHFCFALGSGYIAVGLTDVVGKMGPGDVYVLFVDADGVPRCVDSSTGAGHTSMPPDETQNCVAVSGMVFNGTLTMSFSRLLNTGVCWLSVQPLLIPVLGSWSGWGHVINPLLWIRPLLKHFPGGGCGIIGKIQSPAPRPPLWQVKNAGLLRRKEKPTA